LDDQNRCWSSYETCFDYSEGIKNKLKEQVSMNEHTIKKEIKALYRQVVGRENIPRNLNYLPYIKYTGFFWGDTLGEVVLPIKLSIGPVWQK